MFGVTITENLDKNKNTTSLNSFLENWDKNYQLSLDQIKIFNSELTSQWSKKQRQLFGKTFYHAHGHFHDFLWYLGNNAPSSSIKQIVLTNIAEEFGHHGLSHEQLYFDFAEELGINIMEEFKNQTYYVKFLREFNSGHLNWLADNKWASCFSAFAAYERLDNIDYNYLVNLATSLNLSKKALVFFKVHQHVTYFDTTKEILSNLWNSEQQQVIEGFNFIYKHQLGMWQNLSNHIFALA